MIRLDRPFQPADLRFRLLGPVEVSTRSGSALPMPGSRPVILLATLLLRLNRPVPIDDLVDVLWSDELPNRPRSALQTYVSRLRLALGDAAQTLIRTEPGGYSVRLDPEQVDTEVFRALVVRADEATEPAGQLELLTEALALWRGEPLAGVDSDVLAREHIPRLAEEYLRAQELYFDARLALGDSSGVVPELTELAERYPTRERLWAQLIRAQHASASPAVALETYGVVSRKLAELLGSGPGLELKKLHAELLADNDPVTTVVPHQLPRAVRDFTGRAGPLQRLNRLVTPASSRLGLIIGPAGVGKTSLAIYWAHQMANRFPDGVLYADLLGYGPSTDPADPQFVLPRFLTALGVQADQLPGTLDERIALFRSMLAQRSMLIVLDNARTSDQVRPLAATGAGCLTLVTSRNDLVGLVATDQAEPIQLEVLDPGQSRNLLAARVGEHRLNEDQGSADELISRCAGLPIALSLLGAQMVLRPRWPLIAFVRTLSSTPLDALSTSEGIDVRTVFSWSYRQLRPRAARLFRLLAHHPGQVITVGAAAALAGATVRDTRSLLAELAAAHQLAEIAPELYVLHDLLRSYALELSDEDEAGQAFQRLMEYLVHTAGAAAMVISPTRDQPEFPAVDPAVDLVHPATREEAFAWFDSEQVNHLAVLRAAAGRADQLLLLYVWAIADYIDYQGHPEYMEAQTIALEAAVRLDDLRGQARTRRELARGQMALRNWVEALRQHELANGISEELGDDLGLAHGSLSMARVFTRMGRHRRAIEHTEQALRMYERIGHESGTAHAFNNLGWYFAQLGEYDLALEHSRRALKLYDQNASVNGPPAALDTIAFVQDALGQLDDAISTWEAVTATYRRLGFRHDTAQTLTRLGETHRRAGHLESARTSWTEALAILESVGDADADSVRAQLDSLDAPELGDQQR